MKVQHKLFIYDAYLIKNYKMKLNNSHIHIYIYIYVYIYMYVCMYIILNLIKEEQMYFN